MPHSFAQCLHRGSSCPALRRTVVLKAFLGHVPECSRTWDRESCGLLSGGSASLGLCHFPASPLLLICPFMQSSALNLSGCGHPTGPLSLGTVLSGVPLRKGPATLCFPVSLGGVWADTLCGKAKTASWRRVAQRPGLQAPFLLCPAQPRRQRCFSEAMKDPLAVGLRLLEAAAKIWGRGFSFCRSAVDVGGCGRHLCSSY